jgi:NRAMP (natural resistance-associated macrophage protein)-like metal ion transporter
MKNEQRFLRKIIEAPSRLTETAINQTVNLEKKVLQNKIIKNSNLYLKKLGPGFITGAADEDPSGIATYSQAGAQYGFNFLWMAIFTYPMMSVIQEMCSRISMVTGKGLAENIKKLYSKKLLYICTLLLFIANTLNIGANLGAMAKSIQLVSPSMSFAMLTIIIGLVCIILEITTPYKKYASYLKWLAMSLFAYIATGLIINMDWSAILNATINPSVSFSKDWIIMLTAILGTTISPYLFFWNSGQEVEEMKIRQTHAGADMQPITKKEIGYMRFDVWSGMFLANAVMFFIIAVCATTLFSQGITNITSAADAANALKPLAGEWAYMLFTFGIIGTGMLSIPVLAGSTSYAISESFGWKEGLSKKLKEARAFYGIIILSILIGIALNFVGIDPIKALIYTAIFNGIISPIIIFFIINISKNSEVMGKYKNSKKVNIFSFFILFVMTISAIGAILSL